jgi:hypothetical protein
MKIKLVLISLILLVLSNFCIAQGKIFTKTDADNLFGKVVSSQIITVLSFRDNINSSKKVSMFGFVNKHLIITDDYRRQMNLNSGYQSLPSQQSLHVFSKNILQELLNKGSSDQIIIELRTNVLTITYDNYTLEMSGTCPPNCP